MTSFPTPWDTRSSRDLDSFEEFFWYLESRTPALHVQALSVDGPTTEADWVSAWTALHEANPILQFRIRKTHGQRPRFVQVDAESSMVVVAGELPKLDRWAEEALREPFSDPEEQAVSLRVARSDVGSVVSLTAHHSLLDGRSTLLLVQELLHAVSGGVAATRRRAWSSIRDTLGLPLRPEYPVSDGAAASPVTAHTTPSNPVHVRHLRLEPELTKRIIERSRTHGATPHTALMAAFQIAGGSLRPAWTRDGLYCNTPFDIVDRVADPDAIGMLVLPLVIEMAPTDETGFWKAARDARSALAVLRERGALSQIVGGFDVMTSEEVTPDVFVGRVAANPAAYELMITDYGSYLPTTRFGDLTVDAIATGNNGGGPSTQTIGVCTLDGAMNLTQISLEPMEGLLERCRDVLRTACQT